MADLTANSSVQDMKGYPDGRIVNNNAFWNIGASPSFESSGTTSATLGMGVRHKGDSYNGGSFWKAASQYRDGDWWTMMVPWNVCQEEGDVNTNARLHTASNIAIEYRRVVAYAQLLSDEKWYKVYDGIQNAHSFFRATETDQTYVSGGIEIATGAGGGPKVNWVNDPSNSNTKYSLHQVANQSTGVFNNEIGNIVSSPEGSRIQIYFPGDSGQKFKNLFYATELRLTKWNDGGADEIDNARILAYQGADCHPDAVSTASGTNADGRPPFSHSRNKRLTREFQWFTAWCCNECNSNNFETSIAGVDEAYFRANLPPIFLEEPTTPVDPDPDAGDVEITIGKWYDVEDGSGNPYFSKSSGAVVTQMSVSPNTNISLGPSENQQFTYTVSGSNLTASPAAGWSLSDTTNASIDATSGLLTTNASFTGETNQSGVYVINVILTSNDVPSVKTQIPVTLVPSVATTRKVRVAGLEPDSAGESGIQVSVFYSNASNLTGAKITDINAANIESTLENGEAVMYLTNAAIQALPSGTSVKVAAENQLKTKGFRGVATGTVVDV